MSAAPCHLPPALCPLPAACYLLPCCLHHYATKFSGTINPIMFLLLADLGRVLHHSDGMVTKTNTNPSFFVLNIPLIHPVALRGDMELTCPRLLHNAVYTTLHLGRWLWEQPVNWEMGNAQKNLGNNLSCGPQENSFIIEKIKVTIMLT